MTDDYLLIEEFEASCQVGDTPEEQAFPQVLTLTIKIFLPLQKAGTSDELSDSVNYVDIIEGTKTLLASKKFTLIETVAENVAALVLKHPAVKKVEVHIKKKVFLGIRSVGACVTRTRT